MNRRTILQTSRARRSGGFTLVEVLAALLLIAIVLPIVQGGIAGASKIASNSRHRTEAAGLAESKITELAATGEWQDGKLAGDFAPDWPDYHWQAALSSYGYDSSGQNVQQLDLQVLWGPANRQESVSVSTLVYVKGASTSNE